MTAIRNRKYMSQLVDFEGAVIEGDKSFTDIDAVMEYDDKAYVICEVKYKDGRPTKGQMLALTRMARDLGSVKPVLLILAEHNTRAPGAIKLADCRVRWYMLYMPGKPPTRKMWQKVGKQGNVIRMVELWLRGLT